MSKGPAFRKANAERHRARMEDLRAGAARYNGSGEPQVVPIFELAPLLREYCKTWIALRPYREDEIFVGPVQAIAGETGLSVRQVSRAINEEVAYIGEKQAELLLLAIDQEYLLAGGHIHSYPNPNWSLEKWLDWRREQGCV